MLTIICNKTSLISDYDAYQIKNILFREKRLKIFYLLTKINFNKAK